MDDTQNILITVKKLLGIGEGYTPFDKDIVIHINSVFSILQQLGVGPEEGFRIRTGEENWSDFTSDLNQLEDVKSYMYMKVRLLFDPPTTSFVLDSMKNLISEFEWRLNVSSDSDTIQG